MEVTGRFIQATPEQRGESARGPWVRGGFVIETEGEYPKKIAFTLFGEDKLVMSKNFKMGDPVKVYFNLESREYPAGANKWFTDVRCIRVDAFKPEAPNGTDNTATNFGIAQGAAPMQQPTMNTQSVDEDLPF